MADSDPNIMQCYRDFIYNVVKEEYREEVERLSDVFKNKLAAAFLTAREHKDVLGVSIRGAWVYVSTPYNPAVRRRMYLNCVPEHMDTVVRELINLMLCSFQGKLQQYIAFKFPFFSKIERIHLIKADKIIVYYEDGPDTHEILQRWARSMSKYFHSDAPKFTRQEIDGVGFAYEPLPEHKEYAKEHGEEEVSFSGFMALVIAEHLYSWCISHQKIPDQAELAELAKEILGELVNKHRYPFGLAEKVR